MLEVVDILIEGVTYVPVDETNAQARGLGFMVASWEAWFWRKHDIDFSKIGLSACYSMAHFTETFHYIFVFLVTMAAVDALTA